MDVHPTKMVLIGIDPYPNEYCRLYHLDYPSPPVSGPATSAIAAQDILSFIPISRDLARFSVITYMMLYKVFAPQDS